LEVFLSIYHERSVSGAAKKLALSQPTVSIALGKLRRLFGDPLFVRTSDGMQPTPRAIAVFNPLSTALSSITEAVHHKDGFDAASAERRFRICVSDTSQVILMPRLLHALQERAPGIGIGVVPMTE